IRLCGRTHTRLAGRIAFAFGRFTRLVSRWLQLLFRITRLACLKLLTQCGVFLHAAFISGLTFAKDKPLSVRADSRSRAWLFKRGFFLHSRQHSRISKLLGL